MIQRQNRISLVFAFTALLLGSACHDHYADRRDAGSLEERGPGRDQFVGSVYFKTASSALSKAALADIGRMANRIQERRHAGERVILIGYSDRNRGVEENSEIAGERAQRVAIALEKKGVELERLVIDGRGVRMTRKHDAERRVDIYLENGHSTPGQRMNTLYPVLIGFFLLVTFGLAVVIFRRRR